MNALKIAARSLLRGNQAGVASRACFSSFSYLDAQKQKHTFDLDEDVDHFQALLEDNDITIGVCGGEKICGQCHVLVSENMMDKLNPIDEEEEDILAGLDNRQPNSRLACALEIDEEELDSIVLSAPSEADDEPTKEQMYVRIPQPTN
jgi:2Fe-2S ferredoxin